MENKAPTNNNDKHLLHDLNKPRVTTSLSTPIVIAIVVGALLLGGGTGFGIYYFTNESAAAPTGNNDTTSADGSETSAGILDEKAFPDEAEGILKEGGFEGEGSFHLERPGGEDQKAYLTSSTVDLSDFLDKKVRVRGQTFNAEKAGWLMDVGYVEIVK